MADSASSKGQRAGSSNPWSRPKAWFQIVLGIAAIVLIATLFANAFGTAGGGVADEECIRYSHFANSC